MRLVAILFVLVSSVAVAQPYFQPSTATELFDLRSRCAALGDKFIDELWVGEHAKSLTSHYDPNTNHCYGDVITRSTDDSFVNRSLFDLQTGEVLAFAKIEHGEKVGMVFGRLSDMKGDLGFTDASEYIDKMMHEER
jgi:hypothetical protein